MTLNEWLDADRGRATQVAERFGVSLSAVSQWRSNGVPRRLILDVHEFTGVALAELVGKPTTQEAA
jgi:transcriptional regulator with XRE-family HTH domain